MQPSYRCGSNLKSSSSGAWMTKSCNRTSDAGCKGKHVELVVHDGRDDNKPEAHNHSNE